MMSSECNYFEFFSGRVKELEHVYDKTAEGFL